jgi:transposase InsO family protein
LPDHAWALDFQFNKTVMDRGRAPEFIRCDNQQGLTAHALVDWCKTAGAGTHYIDPGSPWQNAWIESFNSKLRDECPAVEEFNSLLEAQIVIADWRHDYNDYRPHSALGMLTPTEFAARHPLERDARPRSQDLLRRVDSSQEIPLPSALPRK